ncbi:hypothetical protein LPJ59_000411 [Coemansia sp. RSA 2399]|nr:hypothetical protein LPJ59_000411 [Coemansia sp. RSA 2399]
MSNRAGKTKKNSEGCSVFRIPPNVLASLQLSSKLNRVYSHNIEPLSASAPDRLVHSFSETRIARPVCHTCGGVEFADAEQQREHSKTAWHQTNMLRKTDWRRRNVDHAETPEKYPWAPMPEESAGNMDAAAAATTTASSAASDEESDKGKESSPYLWFSPDDAGASATVYGVQRKILATRDSDRSVYTDANRALRQLVEMQASNTAGNSHWAVMSLNGGHFGAAVFDNSTGAIVAHKTLHRYTTRRKQGGSQLREDNAKGRAANSAGAQIRRYNEQKLMEEIRDIVQQWSELLKRCTRVFVRVPRANRKGFPLDWSDERIRSVPVPMARPTLTELQRVYAKITFVKIRTIDLCKPSEEQQQLEQEQILPDLSSDDESEPPSSEDETLEPAPEPELLAFLHDVAAMMLKDSLSNESIVQYMCEHLAELLDAMSDPALGLRYLETTDAIKAHLTPTLLHLASSLGRDPLIPFLLDNGDDPTITNGHPPIFSGGKTAYEVAKDRKTRDEFRVYRFEHEGEEYGVDWKLARVSDPISRERLEEREEKVREKSKNYKKQRKTRKSSSKPTEQQRAAEAPKPEGKQKPPKTDSALFSAEEQRAIDHELTLQALDRKAAENKKANERELRLQAIERRRLQEIQK